MGGGGRRRAVNDGGGDVQRTTAGALKTTITTTSGWTAGGGYRHDDTAGRGGRRDYNLVGRCGMELRENLIPVRAYYPVYGTMYQEEPRLPCVSRFPFLFCEKMIK